MTYRTEDGIYVRVRKGRKVVRGYIAEAKEVPFVSPDGESELTHDLGATLWFDFGDTPDEAIDKVLAEAREARDALAKATHQNE